jgi:CubicO group peptidase (beta-lactamase class C family)
VKANVYQGSRAAVARLEQPAPPVPGAPPRAASSGWLVPAWLLLLGLLPLVFGALRLTQLAGGPRVMPANARTLPRRRGRVAVAVALAAAVAVPAALARPNPPSLSTVVTGDATLAARARPLLPGALDRVSIAVVDGDTATYAGFGADEQTEYEIGSLTKTFTAALLADAIQRGEVTADTKVGALLPLGGAPVADATLAELASHRSGLSAQGMQLGDAIPFFARYLRHRNPFTHDRNGLLALARDAPLGERGAFVYSNLGAALLGHALAAAAHTEYDRMVEVRLFAPLGMAASSLPLTAGDLPRGAPTGYSASGVAEAPWTIDGWAPAGGVRSHAADMVRYARALLDGTAPGAEALEPRWRFGQTDVGYAWLTRADQGHTVTFSNGLTGGFTSKLILDRANRRAVVVLSNTAAQVDDAANNLLVGEHAWTPSP